MQEYFEMIKNARAVQTATPPRFVHERTATDYIAKVARLTTRGRKHGGQLFDGAVIEALKTRKKTSWQAYRAALLYVARQGLNDYLSAQDRAQRECKAAEADGQTANWDAWKTLVKAADHCARAIVTVQAASLPMEGRDDRHSKRRDMNGLPMDWRERVIARMSEYRPATLTAAVTGCRPAELVDGVRLSIECGMLVAHIMGAKVDVARGKGQEWRRLEWPLDHPCAMVRDLAGEVARARGTLTVTIENASNFVSGQPSHLPSALRAV